jgi:hypothetical protein
VILMTSAVKPIRVHVYGPALRWNEENPHRRIPEIAVHPFGFDYRVMMLCDRVTPLAAKQYPILGSHPTDPLPAGKGGKVVVYMTVYGPLEVQTDDPWNWPKKVDAMEVLRTRQIEELPNGDAADWSEAPGPPRIFIGTDITKQALYKKVLTTYLHPRHHSSLETL